MNTRLAPSRRLPAALASLTWLAVISWPGASVQAAPQAIDAAAPSTTPPVASSPPGASVRVKVQVPTTMRSAPFNVDRFLTIPPGFAISVYARIPNARFLTFTPDGNLLVSQPDSGKVKLVRSGVGGTLIVSNFATGLQEPHDMVFHNIGGTTYLYVAEMDKIDRYVYHAGDRIAQGRQILISGLPFQGQPNLRYNHELKNIALDGNHNLYVMLASSCDACVTDTQTDPQRGVIYQYTADGGNRRLFARGLRNAEGLAFVPGTNTLWAVANQQNAVAYPFNDGTGNYGKVIQSYVDNHPPDEFTRVRDGGNYGWPFCNPNPDSPSGLNNMPFDLDYNNNRDGHVSCASMDRINKGILAHSAPLGLTFFQGTLVPAAYRAGAAIALHGSGLRSKKSGYKVIYFPWVNGRPGAQLDLVRGWLINQTDWGRPVDIAVNARGHIFISDDFSGTIYRLFPNQ
jgi:glucose/arabinose dehydrogenase